MVKPIILLFGMPRSGTTWLGKIFDSHPSTLYRHEPDSWRPIEEIPLVADIADIEHYKEFIRHYCADLTNIRAAKVSVKLPLFKKTYYSSSQYALRWLSIMGSKIAAKIIGEVNVPDFIEKQKLAKVNVVWKSIESVGRLGVIVRSLADCRAVLIIRHPCGYAASMLRGQAQNKFEGFSSDYNMLNILLQTKQAQNRGWTLDEIKDMDPIQRMMVPWVLLNEKAMDDMQGLEDCMVFKYEDLCNDPHGMARKLFDFSGLEWSNQVEQFVGQSISKNQKTYYSVYKDPVVSATKWREELTGDKIKIIEEIVARSKPGSLYYP